MNSKPRRWEAIETIPVAMTMAKYARGISAIIIRILLETLGIRSSLRISFNGSSGIGGTGTCSNWGRSNESTS